MRFQGGYSMIEVLVVITIISLMTGVASIAGLNWVRDIRIPQVASQIEDQIILARERAISRYEKWTISFDGTTDVLSHSYVIKYCQAAPANGPDADPCSNPANWRTYADSRLPRNEDGSIRIEGTTGISVRDATSGNLVSTLTFTPDGFFHQAGVTFTICNTYKYADGTESCASGGQSVNIMPLTGRIEG